MKPAEVWAAMGEAAVHAAALLAAAERALVGLKRFGAHEAVPLMVTVKQRAHETLSEISSVLPPPMRRDLKRELRRRGIKVRIPKPRE